MRKHRASREARRRCVAGSLCSSSPRPPLGSILILIGVVMSFLCASHGAQAQALEDDSRGGTAEPNRSLPDVDAGQRQGIADAAHDRALAPWQRDLMLAMTHDVHVGAPERERIEPNTTLVENPRFGTWIQEPTPTLRSAHTAIYDPVRDRMVVFGGAAGSDVWVLSLAGAMEWTRLATSGTPPGPRNDHTAIFDPMRDRMLIFGGGEDFAHNRRHNDVWALSLGANPTWTQLAVEGTLPAPRVGHTAIYDPVRDRMVICGGIYVNGSYDTWALSLAGSPVWTRLTATTSVLMEESSAIYDPVRDRMVVFGGGYGTSQWHHSVSALSLSVNSSWTVLTVSGTPPEGRYSHTAIYDPVRDRMVVFGGYAGWKYNDAWALSLAGSPAWAQISPAGTPPSQRYDHTAIYDPVRDRMVMFGGIVGDRSAWVLLLESRTWTQIDAAGGKTPDVSVDCTAIYDPVRERMVVFAGAFSNEVWALSLAGSPEWTKLTPTGTLPRMRSDHTAIYDPVRDRMVVFGGQDNGFMMNDVWALSLGEPPAWTQLAPAGTPPVARCRHSAIYDPLRDRMVVCGGNPAIYHPFLNDVWVLSLADSPTWTQLTPAGTPPSPREDHAAIYDPVRDRMVVFAGWDGYGYGEEGYRNDVWTLSLADDGEWTPITPSGTLPPGSVYHTIYDPVRDLMLATFGGDVWALRLDDPMWAQFTPAGTPPAGLGTAIYDPVRDRVVVFGGDWVVDYMGASVWDLQLDGASVGVPSRPPGNVAFLAPAYPNPSRSGVTIGFTLPRSGAAILRVYDVSSRLVRTLVEGLLAAGAHSIRWDRRFASGALSPAGLYFYELRVDGQAMTRRVALIE
jgi:hypothetical protein